MFPPFFRPSCWCPLLSGPFVGKNGLGTWVLALGSTRSIGLEETEMTMPCPRSQHTGSSRSESRVRCHRLTARALPFVPKFSYRAYRGFDARCSDLHGHPFYSKGCSKAKASPATPPNRLPSPLGSSPGQLRLATVSLWWNRGGSLVRLP